MPAKSLRFSRVAALLLGAALFAGSADAAVRPVVGKPLQEAQSMAASGNFSGAMAKVHQAEGAGGLTGEESRVISQMKAYIASRQGGGSGPKAKFSNDYRSGRWSAVVSDADDLRGQLDATEQAAVATAYYKLGRNADCVKYIEAHFGNGASDVVLKIQMACAFGAGDDASQTEALEQLVARTQSAEYWGQLLKSAERTRGLKDHDTLDIYRLKLLTGTMTGAQDYTLLAKLALEFELPTEALAVEQKGVDAKLLTDASTTRLVNMTKQQQGAGAAGWAAKLAAAKAAPSGDALIKLGEDLTGQGKAKDAIDLIQQGIAKDKTDMSNAQIRLGQAYLAAGQKGDAARAFNKVKDTPAQATVARLWSLYTKK
jgi:tetratricopeptide (TPR) repeat protein